MMKWIACLLCVSALMPLGGNDYFYDYQTGRNYYYATPRYEDITRGYPQTYYRQGNTYGRGYYAYPYNNHYNRQKYQSDTYGQDNYYPADIYGRGTYGHRYREERDAGNSVDRYHYPGPGNPYYHNRTYTGGQGYGGSQQYGNQYHVPRKTPDANHID